MALRRRLLIRSGATALAVCVLGTVMLPSHADDRHSKTSRSPAISLLDTLTIPANGTQLDTPFGGLSGIDYDPVGKEFIAISDDRSENAPARFYTLTLGIGEKGFTDAGMKVTGVTTLLNSDSEPYGRRTVDPESIRLDPARSGVLWTTEGSTAAGIPPALLVSDRDGGLHGEIDLPTEFVPELEDGRVIRGARNNQSLESLAVSPDGKTITAALENALVQDGPAASLNAPSPSRVVRFERSTGKLLAQYLYNVDPIENAPTEPFPEPGNTYWADRGLSELVALNSTDYLAVERSFATGVGFRVKVYWTSILGASKVKGSVSGKEKLMPKRLVFDFSTTKTVPDNVEGITWGPKLRNGDRTLVLAVDDNFGSSGSKGAFHLLRVPTGSVPINSLDVNKDGKVDKRDAARILLTKAGDIDGDGKRGSKDLKLWATYYEAIKSPPRPKTVDLQLLSFNDFHGNLQPPTGRDATLGTALDPSGQQVGGVEYLAATLNELRRGAGPSLTVAAGDLIGASPMLSGLFHDEPTIDALETLGLDVTSVGNHEFDNGLAELKRIQWGGCHPVDGCSDPSQPYDGAAFPFLAANAVDVESRKPVLAPTWVKTIEGIKVGFIGMTLEATHEVTGESDLASVDFLDEVETANRAAVQLGRRGVKAIVVLLHEGGRQTGTYGQCSGMSGPIVEIAENLDPRIDAVITGHTHQPYICSIPDPSGADRIVTSASAFGRVVTETRLPIDRKTKDVVREAVEARNHLVTRDAGKDAAQTKLINRWSELAAPLMNRVVGTITADITRVETRDRESDLANLVADAHLAATRDPENGGAQIALMNPGGVRADLTYSTSSAGEAPGAITYAEAYAVQPFGGSLASVDLTGAQIEQILEQQFNDSGTRAPTLILGVSEGFEYSYSQSRPVGDRIDPASITLDGVVLDPAAVYRVTANTFLADGGDGFVTFAEGTNRLGGPPDLTALVDYLSANSPVSPPGTDRATELP